MQLAIVKCAFSVGDDDDDTTENNEQDAEVCETEG